MGWGLLTTIYKDKPNGSKVNLNDGSYEYDDDPIYRRVNKFLSGNVHQDMYDAELTLSNEDKDRIVAIPYLADGIKDTAKMKKNIDKQIELSKQKTALRAEWKERALNVNQKTCYSCGSKITQKHEQIKHSTQESASCPNCRAEDYLLTQGSRNKIQKINDKIKILNEQLKVLKNLELEKKLKQKRIKIHWLVGGWLHESELPRNF